MYDVVTGEAVGLDLRLARVPTRALALLVDVAVQLAGLLVVTLVTARLLAGVDDALAAALGLVLTVAVVVGYPTASEALWRGRTLGMAALGLRVVRDDGGPIRFRQALVRALLAAFVDVWTTFGLGALVAGVLSARSKRVGDLLAGTVVVRERVSAAAAPTPPPMPPALAGWAAGADLSRVDDRLALAARQVLARGQQLDPAALEALTRRYADAIAAVTAPPPPAGIPASAYLAAVLAERRRRAEQREGVAAGAASYRATGPAYGAPGPAAESGPAHQPPRRAAESGGFAPPE